MRPHLLAVLLLALFLLASGRAAAEASTHTVGPGHTLGKIAKRYHVTIDALLEANGLSRRDRLKIGQKLVIPDKDGGGTASESDADEDDATTRSAPTRAKVDRAKDEPTEPADEDETKADEDEEPTTRSYGSDGMRVLSVPGHGDAYYYEPVGAGRKRMRPVIMYLHGRGGDPGRDCRRWAPVARRFGWLVCPSGPSAHGEGRDWNNNWYTGQQISVATVKALRQKYARRVQLHGNTLIGFSEGAYVALNVGVREPRTFNRWLILAGNTTYWGGAGIEALKKHARSVKRVYLITGEGDSVAEGTEQLREWLEKAQVSTRVSTPKDMGHEVALERKAGMYRAALDWLDRGKGGKADKAAKRVASGKTESRLR